MTSSMKHLSMRRDSRHLYAPISSVILFLVACVTPALVLHVGQQLGVAGFQWQKYQSILGGHLLVSGLGFGWLRMNFTAFANLPLWASWIFFLRGSYTASRLSACLALALSVETLQLMVQPYLWDEAATRQGYLAAPHIGFVCWIGSMMLMALASHRILATQRQHVSGPISFR
jgi:hypothetical protein